MELRTVRFVTTRKFCASRYDPRNSDFLRKVPTNTKIFCAVYDFAGGENICKGCWNPK